MCQLFALNSNTPSDVTFSFTGFSARGGATGEHVDGWGMAFHDERGCQVFIDEKPASQSPLAEFLRRHPIKANSVLAHIRKATRGAVQLSNCHPFQRQWRGRHWAFCHNGTLENFAPALESGFQPVGSTDSEAAFCWLLQQLEQRFVDVDAAPSWAELAPVLAELSAELASYGSFNIVLSDGEAVYTHCSTRLHWLSRSHPFAQARLIDTELSLDLSRANGPNDRMVLVATEPLTHDEPWQAMAAGEFFVFVQGQPVWRAQTQVQAPLLAAA
ncbi:class II glutamine amidotransferase [Paucibacter sp. TC2R-5]|uniref:class II glutamine amidotransferase n=1 Tax=Paucibacter sp. TC2R-5 TaxID=2893555 RepID=UPI0021E3BEB8|nr:class II glutamine amidotransferase [Paucibacter sp. TC2R-5]MCV2361259.1 class II glutamine amidotransferase [Paucibacter sp. TC2R-5]